MVEKLSFNEAGTLLVLLILLLTPFIKAWNSKDQKAIWSPLTMVMFVYMYYVVIGPLFALWNDDTYYRTLPHREYYLDSYLGAVCSILFIYIGYFNTFKGTLYKFLIRDVSLAPNNERLIFLAKRIFVFCFICILIVSGAGIINKFNPLSQTDNSVGYNGSFKQYLLLTMNTLTMSSLLLLKPFMEGQSKKLYLFFTFLVFSLYVNEAFRYRLVILLFSSLTFYHLYNHKKFNTKLMVGLLVPFMALMGIMEISRSYGQGIDLNRLEESEKGSVESSFGESKVFLSTGFLIANFEKVTDYKGFEPVFTAATFPIPRGIWPGKPDGGYLLNTINDLYTKRLGLGVAFLNYGEYYISFGWFGIALYSFAFGIFLKWGWVTYLKDPENVYSITFYALFSSFSYVTISRGYLPLTFVNYMFFVFPSYYLLKKYRERTASY